MSQNITVKLRGIPTTSQHISNHSAFLDRKHKVEDGSAYQADGSFHRFFFSEDGNRLCRRNIFLYFILDECIAEFLKRKLFQKRCFNLALQCSKLKLFVTLMFLPFLSENFSLFVPNGPPAVCLTEPAQL